jgi:hypothetical protein
MMMRRFWLLLHRRTPQKFLFFLIFLVFEWPFRVVALHLHAFFHRQLRQMPNEEYQFPVVLRSMAAAKGRHASEADSVFDDPE